MTARLMLRGVELRYVITDHLFRHGAQSIPDVLDELEVRRGRLRRLRRGRYGPDEMPRGTEHRIYTRAMALRAKAALMTGRDDDRFWDRLADQPT